MNFIIDIAIYFWTFILWSFIAFTTHKIPSKYLSIIWKNNPWSFDFHTIISRILFIASLILITILFFLPFLLLNKELESQNLILFKEYFYLITWTIWLFLLFITIIIPKKEKEDKSK